MTLSDLGRREEALAVSQEAVDITGVLADKRHCDQHGWQGAWRDNVFVVRLWRCSDHACSCRCAPPWVRLIPARHRAWLPTCPGATPRCLSQVGFHVCDGWETR